MHELDAVRWAKGTARAHAAALALRAAWPQGLWLAERRRAVARRRLAALWIVLILVDTFVVKVGHSGSSSNISISISLLSLVAPVGLERCPFGIAAAPRDAFAGQRGRWQSGPWSKQASSHRLAKSVVSLRVTNVQSLRL
jgi:hypothetical protein